MSVEPLVKKFPCRGPEVSVEAVGTAEEHLPWHCLKSVCRRCGGGGHWAHHCQDKVRPSQFHFITPKKKRKDDEEESATQPAKKAESPM